MPKQIPKQVSKMNEMQQREWVANELKEVDMYYNDLIKMSRHLASVKPLKLKFTSDDRPDIPR